MNLNSAASMVIMERCQLVGGITWYCFGGWILTEDELSLEIATLPLSQLPTVDKDINLSPRIFHRYCICNTDEVDTASVTVCVKFGSTKIAEMVYKHLGNFEMNHMVRLIESKISGAYANLKGNLFETFMHDCIVHGRTFQACLYDSKPKSTESINFGKLSTLIFFNSRF